MLFQNLFLLFLFQIKIFIFAQRKYQSLININLRHLKI